MTSRHVQHPLSHAVAIVLVAAAVVLAACFPGLLMMVSNRYTHWAEKHPDAAEHFERGKTFSTQERIVEAEEEFRTALALALHKLGPEHPDTLKYSARLAWNLRTQQKWPEVSELLAQHYPTARRVLKEGDQTLILYHQLNHVIESAESGIDKK